MSIYLLQGGNQTGPFPVEQVHQSVQAGLVPGDTLAWTEGLSEWEPVSSLLRGYIPQKSRTRVARARKKKEDEDASWWTYVIKGIATFGVGYVLFTYGLDHLMSSRSKAPTKPEGHLELMVTKVAPLSLGAESTSTQCSIQVTNQKSSVIRLVSLEVQGLDSSGVVVATNTANLENLEPGQTRMVEVTFFGVLPGKITRINTTVRSATFRNADGTLANTRALALSMVPFDEAHGNVLSLEAVRKHAPGTWTGNDNQGAQFRLVLNPDGTTTEFMAHPTNQNWGTGTPGRWEPFTGKYDDSGRRYFGVKLSRGGYTIFQSSTEMTLPNLRMTLTKGDQFPFSK